MAFIISSLQGSRIFSACCIRKNTHSCRTRVLHWVKNTVNLWYIGSLGIEIFIWYNRNPMLVNIIQWISPIRITKCVRYSKSYITMSVISEVYLYSIFRYLLGGRRKLIWITARCNTVVQKCNTASSFLALHFRTAVLHFSAQKQVGLDSQKPLWIWP